MLVMVGIPIWTDPSDIVIAVAGTAAVVCAVGLVARILALVTAGAVIGAIAYALATVDSADGADVVAATLFGLALLALLDLSEFVRRTRGVAVTAAAVRGQVTYWLARLAIIIAAVAGLLLCATALAMIIPGALQAALAGIGVVIAFAAALRAGIGRPVS